MTAGIQGGDGRTYKIKALNDWANSRASIDFDGGSEHYVGPDNDKAYRALGTIDWAELVYGREVGGTEFWDVFIRNYSVCPTPASDSIDSTDSTDSTPAPAQSGTQNARNTEPTQGDLQSNSRRRSWVGVHNDSSHLIWVKVDKGNWIDNPPPPTPSGWWPIQPGAAFVIVGDGGSFFAPGDVFAHITPGTGRDKAYSIWADNESGSTSAWISFGDGESHWRGPPNYTSPYTEVGLIDSATLVYGREVGGTEFWDVFIRSK